MKSNTSSVLPTTAAATTAFGPAFGSGDGGTMEVRPGKQYPGQRNPERPGSGQDLGAGEEEADLDRGVLDAVRTMHGIGFDALGELSAHGLRLGLLRIGRAHHVAVLQDGALA